MVKKIKFVIPLLFALVCVCSFSLESRAANIPMFNILSDRPAVSENMGYIELYGIRNSDGYSAVKVIKWYCQNVESYGDPYVNMYINSNGNISLAPQVTEHFSVFYISSDGMDTWERIYDGNLGPNAFYPDVMSGYTIKSYRIYGNVASATDNLSGYNSYQFTVAYNYEIKQYEELEKIYSELVKANANDTTMINKINQIYNSVDTVESKLQQLTALQEDTNTWLEKIFDWLNETKEEERQEVQTQGSNSVSQGSDSIENSGQGFGDSLGGLVSSMSYSGTECSWTFPQVKMPRIEGVMDEVVLIEEQKIDFGMWVDAIPSNIMLLIRSVLTGALIIYCFKELYGTISYVLTLKGSGVNE